MMATRSTAAAVSRWPAWKATRRTAGTMSSIAAAANRPGRARVSAAEATAGSTNPGCPAGDGERRSVNSSTAGAISKTPIASPTNQRTALVAKGPIPPAAALAPPTVALSAGPATTAQRMKGRKWSRRLRSSWPNPKRRRSSTEPSGSAMFATPHPTATATPRWLCRSKLVSAIPIPASSQGQRRGCDRARIAMVMPEAGQNEAGPAAVLPKDSARLSSQAMQK